MKNKLRNGGVESERVLERVRKGGVEGEFDKMNDSSIGAEFAR